MAKKRIFISIDLPEEVKIQVQALKNPQIRWIKWMSPDNLHVTLNFLGELSDAQIETAKQVIKETVPYYSPFPLAIDKTRAQGAMLWLEMEPSEPLFELREELTRGLRKQKIRKRERQKYRPHILIARSKNETRRMLWQPDEFEPMKFPVERINLYESRLTPGSATHILIESFELGEVYEN